MDEIQVLEGEMAETFKHGAGFLDRLGSLGRRSGPIEGGWASSVGLTLVLTAGYFLLGRLAFSMAVSEGSATSMAFLPEGLALAFTIIFGCRVSPGIFFGQLILSTSLGIPAGIGAAFGLINMIEDSVGGWLFWKWRISPSLGRPGDVARLFALSALVLQPAAAIAKAFPRMAISGPSEIYHLSVYSWAGNTMGQFLLVPLFLTWCSERFRFDRRELLRGSLILGVYFAGILLFEFLDLARIDRLYWLSIFGAFYLVLIWNAVQSGSLVASLANFLATMGFLWAIVANPDSLLYFSTQDRVLYADVLIFGGVVTSLIIAALFSQLREKTALLIQANQAKERLLAIVGHDLRSPIVSFRTALDLVKAGRMEQKDFLSVQEHLRTVTDHTRWTLENIMEWAALQLDELKHTPAPWVVRSVARDALELLRASAESKGIQVEIDVSDEIVVWADRHQLGSIFRNLLSNAIKFTGQGGSVRISATRLEKFWKFSVQDTGVGMTPRQMEGLFGEERGFSTSVGTARERGAGLGLRIASSFVNAHGGALTVESVQSQGSVFHFTLPVPPEDPV